MEKKKYNADLMRIMSLFESLTKTPLKDCFVDKNDCLRFVVEEVYLSKAIGRKAQNIKKLQSLLNRKIKIVGFNPIIQKFVKNLVYPLELKGVQEQGGVVTVSGADTHTRAHLIGKNRQNLKNYLGIIQRYFKDVKELKVV